MNRRAATVVACVVALAIGVGAAWTVPRGATTPRAEATPDLAATSPADAAPPWHPKGKTRIAVVAPTDAARSVDRATADLRVVTGRVLDASTRTPIADADVWFLPIQSSRSRGFGGPSVTTDADGRFWSDEVPVECGDAVVRASGHVTTSFGFRNPAAPSIDVSLDPAGRARGVVRFADGRPIASGTRVRVDFGRPYWCSLDPEAFVGTIDGSFEVDGIPLGVRFDLHVDLFGADATATRRGFVLRDAADVVACDLVLVPRAQLVVRATWPDGESIVGASVRVETPGADDSPLSAATKDGGVAGFSDVPEGRHVVVVEAAGFERFERDFVLSAGDARTVDARLAPERVVSGIVVDDLGAPVAESIVSADDADDAPKSASRADGTFRIACRDGSPRRVRALRDGRDVAAIERVTAPRDGLRLVVPRRAVVMCRLVIPENVLDFFDAVQIWWRAKPGDPYGNCGGKREGGRLTIELPLGRGQAKFRVPDCVAVERDVDLAPGEVEDWGDVALVATGKLVGRVIDVDGRPVANASVRPTVFALPFADTTDADGRFSFDCFESGEVALRVEAEGFVAGAAKCASPPDATPAVVVLLRGGVLRGRALDAAGRPAANAYVVVSDARNETNADRAAWPAVDAEGSFEVHLSAGRYEVRVSSGGRRSSTEVDVVEGGTSDVTLRFAR